MDNQEIKNLLDALKLNNNIYINNWETPMTVKGISTNFIVCFDNLTAQYTVISKKPWNLPSHNALVKDSYYCGPDDWLFGDPYSTTKYPDLYYFNNKTATEYYLNQFENGKNHISQRNGCAIEKISLS